MIISHPEANDTIFFPFQTIILWQGNLKTLHDADGAGRNDQTPKKDIFV